MRTIRVETSAATILLTEAPEPKVRDRQSGEIAKDAVSGEALMTIGVVYIEEGESSLIKVTVPESGVSEGLTLGAPVSLPGLVARPWESVFMFNGQQRHGIAFRAAAVTPAAFPAAVGASA
ncbi:SCO3933 family regulatory protein [Streptomyces sp. C-3]